jgi:polysaccharide biosynthesis transport protein
VTSQTVPMDKVQGTFDTYRSASPFIEAFRSLNANLRLLSGSNSIRSLVISSPAPGDGKSTVALNLAQAAAAMGQRVLLVDADLRWPQIEAKLGLSGSTGLTDLLASDLTPDSVIKSSQAEANLFVITAGSHTTDPLRLLSSKKMLSLMSQWRMAYDLVIYDTPPLLGLADSSLLAGYTDGMLLIVGISHTDQSEFKQALQGLQMAGTPILGVVANQVKETVAVYSEPRPIPQNLPNQKEENTVSL